VARAAEVILIRLTGWLGGSEVVAQHLFYALVMAFAAFGAAYLAGAFVRDPVAIGVAGLLGSFNVFVLVHLPNPLTMIWLGLVGTCGGMLLRVARGASLSVVTFAAVTLGATRMTVFRRVTVPLLAPVLSVVFITMIINVLKVFDIVFTINNGHFSTDVLARQMYADMFVTNQVSRGSALAVLLFLCVLPLVFYNIRQLRREREVR